MSYHTTINGTRWTFHDLEDAACQASPARSGDALAGVAAQSAIERVAAQMALADLPLKTFLNVDLVPYEEDEVSRLILDSHDLTAFEPVSHLTVGGFREWLLDTRITDNPSDGAGPGPDPGNGRRSLQDHARARPHRGRRQMQRHYCFPQHDRISRTTLHAAATEPSDQRFPRELRPACSTDFCSASATRRSASIPRPIVCETMCGSSACSTSVWERLDVPTQTCCLGHVTTAIQAINLGAPVDLIFQSIAGSEKANRGFGISLSFWRRRLMPRFRSVVAQSAGTSCILKPDKAALCPPTRILVSTSRRWKRVPTLSRGGSSRCSSTRSLASSVPNISYNGKEITRAGLEDHFCGKLLGIPMGCDVCYTNHAEADQDDMDALLTLLSAAGVTFVIAVPGADDSC